MEAIASYDDMGNLLRYCYVCKEIKSTIPKIAVHIYRDGIAWRIKRRCLSCGIQLDYYKHLMGIPKIRDDY